MPSAADREEEILERAAQTVAAAARAQERSRRAVREAGRSVARAEATLRRVGYRRLHPATDKEGRPAAEAPRHDRPAE